MVGVWCRQVASERMSDQSIEQVDEAAGRRTLGGFDLVAVVGQSARTMAWRGVRRDDGSPVLLVAPRVPPADAAALARWAEAIRRAARLDHPQLPKPLWMGAQAGWPFVAYADTRAQTLGDRLGPSLTPREAAYVIGQAAVGLAFAHDAGVAHGDVQSFLVRVTDAGHVELLGLEVAFEASAAGAGKPSPETPVDPAQLRRLLMRRDVTSLGLLLHHALADHPALEEPDVTQAAARLPPTGRETVRLPWMPGRVIPQALRLVADRATERQESARYLSARTFVRALEEWLQAESLFGVDVLTVLEDRIGSAGLLPSTPGTGERAARMALMESERTQDLAEVILEDPALAFELLRQVNSAQERSASGMASGPVLTVTRAIAMLGMQGVRRAALSLRPWPGGLQAPAATRLRSHLDRCLFAARVAQAIRPRGFEGEVVHLVTLLQSLGGLAVRHHFPSEAVQIEAIARERVSEESPELIGDVSAALAVLGVDFEALAAHVVKDWGLSPQTLRMMRRMPQGTPVHTGGDDNEILRATASCALEAVEALERESARRDHAISRVAHRYATALSLSERDLRWALGELAPAAGSLLHHEGTA